MGLVLGGIVELAHPALSSIVGSRFLCTFFPALLAPGLQWQEVLESRCQRTQALEFFCLQEPTPTPRGWEAVGTQSLLLMATLGLAPGAPLGWGCQLPFLQLPFFFPCLSLELFAG